MEDLAGRTPVFKKMDKKLFEQMDQFKKSQAYLGVQDFFNGLDEEQQKVFKAGAVVLTVVLPMLLLLILWWENRDLRADLDLRTSIINKSNEILGQDQALRRVNTVLSESPIDSQSMMTTRLTSVLSRIGVDLSKIQVGDFKSERSSDSVLLAEAQITFTNMATTELMNLITGMIQGDRFRIESVDIKRNPNSNLLQGKFKALHYSAVRTGGEE